MSAGDDAAGAAEAEERRRQACAGDDAAGDERLIRAAIAAAAGAGDDGQQGRDVPWFEHGLHRDVHRPFRDQQMRPEVPEPAGAPGEGAQQVKATWMRIPADVV